MIDMTDEFVNTQFQKKNQPSRKENGIERVQPDQGTKSNSHPRLKPNEFWKGASLQEDTSKCHDPGVATFG